MSFSVSAESFHCVFGDNISKEMFNMAVTSREAGVRKDI